MAEPFDPLAYLDEIYIDFRKQVSDRENNFRLLVAAIEGSLKTRKPVMRSTMTTGETRRGDDPGTKFEAFIADYLLSAEDSMYMRIAIPHLGKSVEGGFGLEITFQKDEFTVTLRTKSPAVTRHMDWVEAYKQAVAHLVPYILRFENPPSAEKSIEA